MGYDRPECLICYCYGGGNNTDDNRVEKDICVHCFMRATKGNPLRRRAACNNSLYSKRGKGTCEYCDCDELMVVYEACICSSCNVEIMQMEARVPPDPLFGNQSDSHDLAGDESDDYDYDSEFDGLDDVFTESFSEDEYLGEEIEIEYTQDYCNILYLDSMEKWIVTVPNEMTTQEQWSRVARVYPLMWLKYSPQDMRLATDWRAIAGYEETYALWISQCPVMTDEYGLDVVYKALLEEIKTVISCQGNYGWGYGSDDYDDYDLRDVLNHFLKLSKKVEITKEMYGRLKKISAKTWLRMAPREYIEKDDWDQAFEENRKVWAQRCPIEMATQKQWDELRTDWITPTTWMMYCPSDFYIKSHWDDVWTSLNSKGDSRIKRDSYVMNYYGYDVYGKNCPFKFQSKKKWDKIFGKNPYVWACSVPKDPQFYNENQWKRIHEADCWIYRDLIPKDLVRKWNAEEEAKKTEGVEAVHVLVDVRVEADEVESKVNSS